MSDESFKKIMVAIDGSAQSFRAATQAIELAKRSGSELILLHVLAINQNLRLVGVYGSSSPESIAEHIKAEEQVAASWFQRIVEQAKEAFVNCSSEVIEGPLSTVGEIVQYAEEHKVDLIVIGSRGMTGFKKLILGSTASGVVTYAPCSVLVVK